MVRAFARHVGLAPGILSPSTSRSSSSNVKLTRTHTRGERSDTLSFEMTTDGKELHRKEGEYESWSSMTWLGAELVLDMKMSYKGEMGTNVFDRVPEGVPEP